MTNEETTTPEEEVVEGKEQEEVEEEAKEEELDDEGNPKKSKNPELTPEQKLGIKKRQFKKLAKELDIELPDSKPKTDKIKKDGFDYGQKAFLKANDIKPSEYDIVQGYVDAGKELDEVLDETTVIGKIVKAELEERRETTASKEAIPSGSKRSTSSTRDSVEYWIAKKELPADKKLAQKVVNARIKEEESKSNFTDTPVV